MTYVKIVLFILLLFLTLFLVYYFLFYSKEKYNQPIPFETNVPVKNSLNSRYLNFSNNKYRCLKPRDYHRYGSNLCDPTQEKLPITFPNPNEDIPPLEMSTEEEKLVCGLKDGISTEIKF